jgi:hypothetical protein
MSCPFCGAQPVVTYTAGHVLIRCRNKHETSGCPVLPMALGYNEPDAMKKWNTRQGEPRIAVLASAMSMN